MLVHIHIKNMSLCLFVQVKKRGSLGRHFGSQMHPIWGWHNRFAVRRGVHELGNIDHDTLGEQDIMLDSVSICLMAFFVAINRSGHDKLPHRLEKEVFASLCKIDAYERLT